MQTSGSRTLDPSCQGYINNKVKERKKEPFQPLYDVTPKIEYFYPILENHNIKENLSSFQGYLFLLRRI